MDIFYYYINTLLLLEVRSFNSSLRAIKDNIDDLQMIYYIVGKVDAYQALASYREDLAYYTSPAFTSNTNLNLSLVDGYHPLLEEPVSNTIHIKKKGIIITGSNMAGKSTFLRTLGLNTLFAQTISTVCGTAYKAGLFKIITSISRTDNILKGKSFYFVEAERLLELLKNAEGELPTLCIIDEMLAGTNSMERINASREILNYLAKQKTLPIIATHDLQLANTLSDKYQAYHFTDNVSKQTGLDFDYKIKEGVAVTTNAIKLLDYLGYPTKIVNKAEKKATEELSRILGA